MSTEKRSPTADEIAKLIKQSWNSAGSQYPIVEKLRNALEAQADQLKQAREIIEQSLEDPPPSGYPLKPERPLQDDCPCETCKARRWLAANPAPTTESEHGND